MNPDRMRRRGPLIVGLGEALFDCFADHEQIGGAPVNLAVHAHLLLRPVGGRAVIASAVGNDLLGNQFFALLEEWAIDHRMVKVDPIHPTGRVDVVIDDLGQPSYQFEANVAWDYLEFTESWELLASDCDAVSFGSIAQRSAMSRETITRFLQVVTRALRLYDVNLRQDFFTSEIIRRSFELASAAKLNIDELPIVCKLLGLDVPNAAGIDRAIGRLIELFQLDWLALTLGPLGTVLYTGDNRYEAEIPIYETHANADGVGAGDACGAGLLVATLMDWPYEKRVALANNMGSFVASRRGAIPELPRDIVEGVTNGNSAFSAKSQLQKG